MARNRFVKPESKRRYLPDGEWVELKKRLSVIEEREAFQAVIGEVNTEGWRRPNLKMMGLAEVAAYVVDWSFEQDGKRVPPSIHALGGLDPADFKELEELVTAHIAEMEAEADARKNAQAGESKSEAILLSAG